MPSVAQRVMEQYPQFAFLLRDPQVGSLLARATNPAQPWSDLKFKAELQKTSWYRRHSAAQRKTQILMYTDPMTYKQELGSYQNQLTRFAQTLGISTTPAENRYLSAWLMQRGLEANSLEAQQALLRLLRANPRKGTVGAIGREQYNVNSLVWGDWLSPRSPKSVAYWGTQIALGAKTLADVNAAMAKEAAKKYPHFADEIAGGATLKDIIADNVNLYAQEMEVNPLEIYSKVVTNGWERQILGIRDPKSGKTRAPTQAEVQRMARSTPSWWNTQGGKQKDAQLGATILNIFGKRKMGGV